MRCDVSQLPMESQNWDPGMAAYNGMQMVDMYHNHPIKWAFCHILIVRMKARSKRRCAAVCVCLSRCACRLSLGQHRLLLCCGVVLQQLQRGRWSWIQPSTPNSHT